MTITCKKFINRQNINKMRYSINTVNRSPADTNDFHTLLSLFHSNLSSSSYFFTPLITFDTFLSIPSVIPISLFFITQLINSSSVTQLLIFSAVTQLILLIFTLIYFRTLTLSCRPQCKCSVFIAFILMHFSLSLSSNC